jgi:hypothetical protein
MTSTVAARPVARARVGGGVWLAVGLWLAAAAISAFTMRRYLDALDEGILLQAVSRIAAGQWPYADFGWAYGPGHPLLMAGVWETFGPTVVAWRVVRVLADATIAVLVWWLVAREAGPRWALFAWLAAATTTAQPTTANPAPLALALGLAAVAAAVRAGPPPAAAGGRWSPGGPAAGGRWSPGGPAAAGGRWSPGGPAAIARPSSPRAPTAGYAIAAGVLAALAIFWRPDIGGIAAVAAIATLVAARAARPALLAAGSAVLGALVLFAPFAVAAGVPRLWDSLVAQSARDGDWWRLPFPLVYNGPLRAWPPDALAEDLKDVLGYYLPLLGVVALAACGLAVLARRGRVPPVVAGLGVLAAGGVAYLLSRPDELHIQPLLIVLCALLPILAAGRGALTRVLAACLALIALAGVANRFSALVLPPDLEPVRLAGVPGIRVPPAEAAALPPLVARVQQLVPPGEPIYVAPRRSDLVTRSNPLIHFLTRRANVLHRDVLLQARPEEQERIVAALRRAHPRAVVRWLDPASSQPEPNSRGRPSGSRALDEYLASAYRPDARFGAYQVLVPR